MLELFSSDLSRLKDAISKKDSNLLFSNFEKTRAVRKEIIDAGQAEGSIALVEKKSQD
jgi:hypothetical protein